MMIIMYPYEIQNDSNFEFEYWIAGYSPDFMDRMESFFLYLKKDRNWLVVLLATLLFCTVIAFGWYVRYRSNFSIFPARRDRSPERDEDRTSEIQVLKDDSGNGSKTNTLYLETKSNKSIFESETVQSKLQNYPIVRPRDSSLEKSYARDQLNSAINNQLKYRYGPRLT